MKLLIAMHDAKAALYAGLGRETFASLAGDFEKRGFLDRTVGLPYGLRVVGYSCGTTTHMRRRKIGQEAGICTRTVSFTGRDAANYTTILIGNGLPAVAAQVEMNCPPSLKLWWAAFARRFAAGEGWIPWSDSHRRIAVYKTAPVAAEAQGLEKLTNAVAIARKGSTPSVIVVTRLDRIPSFEDLHYLGIVCDNSIQ